MEWVILDDGTDCVEDLVTNMDWIKVNYFHYKEQLLLGKKRNLMHSKCKGDIIVYMDDDDYYPPERVSHAVEMLTTHPSYNIAGSSEMHLYYHDLNKLYQCGPYGNYHATAATFVFRKELLQDTQYNNTNALAEETDFLKKYSIPLLQLDPLKTIMVISHSHNSFDKRKMLETPLECKITDSRFNPSDYIKDDCLMQMYTRDIHVLLKDYAPGTPDHKPEILKQMKTMQENRDKRMAEHNKRIQQETTIMNALKPVQFNSMEQMKHHYEKIIADKSCLIQELLKKIKGLNTGR